ncbi:acetoin utilization protein AcuC [Evansella cellulosilytica]|uniref:Acetoin utilization protein AcuC n=1 Tax=Evansella cellulosilytica (strain ATCC 21833 / DSM 2522 / FERM P-1141 / JCM 9156 / N-4) TaxID=649639 RepID=E6U165_EVAC2|nr:acetoin utilization protein AcuC [Evansella cellulosilytica]ADU31511.1 Histone deacetylase [Evansella cellulosilytica DSM 2522]
MNREAAFIYSPQQLSYKFSEHHPFNQKRLTLTKDLLEKLHALNPNDIYPARKATDEELSLIHEEDFITAVKGASMGEFRSSYAMTYGIGTEDTPVFPYMHDAAAWLVGGTLAAVDLVFEQGFKHAINLGGGLHHGFRGKASGFCIYNDSSIAIEYMRKKYDAKVLYVDTDAHHGDGVQWAFYDDPNVCTLSFHESGRFLFPGSGHVNEFGHGEGYGYSFNVPFEAFTEDSSFLSAYESVMREVIAYFKPDIILTQNGADAHYYDPLTHLCGTLRLYQEIPKLAHSLAHEYCNGKWIAVGGGGYDIWRVVPRAWAAIWLEMSNQTNLLKNPIPNNWIDTWQKESPHPLPLYWDDPSNMYPPIPRKTEIEKKNRRTAAKVLHPIYD